MKYLVLLALAFFSLMASEEEQMLKATPYEFVKTSIGKGKPYFLEVGSEVCKSCKMMSKQLYKITQQNPSYNIHFINVRNDRKVANALKVRMIPSQIIYDKDGNEVYRHIGFIDSKELAELFKTYKFE
jgi:thioredoxin 1